MNKFDLVKKYNAMAHEEIENAEKPHNKGNSFNFGYDPFGVWGVTAEEIDEFIIACEKIKRNPFRFKDWRDAKSAYWAWNCRRAAMHGLSVGWM